MFAPMMQKEPSGIRVAWAGHCGGSSGAVNAAAIISRPTRRPARQIRWRFAGGRGGSGWKMDTRPR